MKLLLFICSLCILNSNPDKPIECGDLLARYDEKIPNVEFIECHKGKDQTIVETKYKVAGTKAKEVEKILIEKYGLGALKFVCCGWEPSNGQSGEILNTELKEINPYYYLEISMYANAEKQDKNGEVYIEKDRSKVDFYITVRLLEV